MSYLFYFGTLLLYEPERMAHVISCDNGYSLLCNVISSRGVGGAIRDIPRTYKRIGHGRSNFLPVGSLFSFNLYISYIKRMDRNFRNIYDICDYLLNRLLFY